VFPQPELPMSMPLIIINDLALHRIPIAVADVAAVTDTMPAKCSLAAPKCIILRSYRFPLPHPRSFAAGSLAIDRAD